MDDPHADPQRRGERVDVSWRRSGSTRRPGREPRQQLHQQQPERRRQPLWRPARQPEQRGWLQRYPSAGLCWQLGAGDLSARRSWADDAGIGETNPAGAVGHARVDEQHLHGNGYQPPNVAQHDVPPPEGGSELCLALPAEEELGALEGASFDQQPGEGCLREPGEWSQGRQALRMAELGQQEGGTCCAMKLGDPFA